MNASAPQGNGVVQPTTPVLTLSWTKRPALILAAIAIGILVAAVYSMNRSRDYTIELVIPNNYRGVIVIEQDTDLGTEPVVRDGSTYVYAVPDSGTLLVKSFDLFEEYHFTIARYADGRTIPTQTPGGKGPVIKDPEATALYGLGGQIKGREKPKALMCVGNRDDYRAYRKRYGFE